MIASKTRLAGKIIGRYRRLALQIKCRLYMSRFLLVEKSVLRQLKIGLRVNFEVPVQSNGLGCLLIGNDNAFGYWAAPQTGDGGILLQPRSYDSEIQIGSYNNFSNNVTLIANRQIIIGDACLIGDQVAIYDCDFHEVNPANRRNGFGLSQPVLIGNNVWIGSRVLVLKGVTIGDNSVIGAMSLVTKSIPKNCIAAGNPAKVIRKIE